MIQFTAHRPVASVSSKLMSAEERDMWEDYRVNGADFSVGDDVEDQQKQRRRLQEEADVFGLWNPDATARLLGFEGEDARDQVQEDEDDLLAEIMRNVGLSFKYFSSPCTLPDLHMDLPQAPLSRTHARLAVIDDEHKVFGRLHHMSLSSPALSLSTLIWQYARQFVKMDTKEALEALHIYSVTASATDQLITQVLVLDDLESAVSLCLASARYADAILLAHATPSPTPRYHRLLVTHRVLTLVAPPARPRAVEPVPHPHLLHHRRAHPARPHRHAHAAHHPWPLHHAIPTDSTVYRHPHPHRIHRHRHHRLPHHLALSYALHLPLVLRSPKVPPVCVDLGRHGHNGLAPVCERIDVGVPRVAVPAQSVPSWTSTGSWVKPVSRLQHSYVLFPYSFLVTLVWLFVALLAGIGNAVHKDDLYESPTPHWCWIGQTFLGLRLGGEYVWFWVTLLVSSLAYLTLFLWARGHITPSDTTTPHGL
ncbi:hypothetical protein B0H14DRAFT_3744115 [Mycena olivaceomarginata]|nr:hypothetical protein B0H14DRAFT_3744115 [Mycena olivaceomarginata]